MRRWLYHHQTVSGDPEELTARLRERLRDLLVAGTGSPRAVPAGDGSFLVRLPAVVLDTELAKTVRVTTGVASTGGARLVIPLAWRADPVRHGFPAFEGAIELEPLDRARAQLTIVGSYRIPASLVGLVADTTVLHGVAERSTDRLLDGLAHALSRPVDHTGDPAPADAPMRVIDVMTPDPLVLGDDQPLRTAALLLFNYEIGGAPVVDAHGALVGVISEADLVEKQALAPTGLRRGVAGAWRRRDALTVGQACTRPARVTAPDSTLHDAARELLDHRVARLVVVDGSRIAGIVTRHDVLRALLRSDAGIQAAVEGVCRRRGEPEVTATVEWGVVTLSGTTARLSRIRPLVREIEALDGVMATEADALAYREDDVTPLAVPFS